VIECITPEVDDGRHAVKRVVGDVVWVGADIFKEGHDQLAARVLYMGPSDSTWRTAAMRYDYDADRWFGAFVVDRVGRWSFTVEAWTDSFAAWRGDFTKKLDAGQDVSSELLEGAQLVRAAARSAKAAPARASLQLTARVLEDRRDVSVERKVQRALDDDLLALMTEFYKPGDVTRSRAERFITVDRERASAAAWYELFPRSQTEPALDGKARHGTFADAAARLPRVAGMGFDVVYLPPIHPIGHTHRKGRNNSLVAEPDDVGSPWAIGNEDGGHTAVDPRLGTLEDFDAFVQAAAGLGMEVALDFALQCSPDHPWVREHPEWFFVRPDGSIKYAENPPKKYQDIYPLNFWCTDRDALWNACRDVVLFWVGHGVKTFRVDNPHTKPFSFWEWLIADVQRAHPDVIFLAEAFTRPKRMKHLAKLGFTQSYTYFTWKNSSWEIREYLNELARSPAVEYFRGNLFANTPDILTDYLATGGRPAFRVRLLLAATLLPLYGIYSGFELCEHEPVREGSEEYLDSEKYQLRPRRWDTPGNIADDVAFVNHLRAQHSVLREYGNLTFCDSENPAVVCYMRGGDLPGERGVPAAVRQAWREETGASESAKAPRPLLFVVNTDPHRAQDTMVHVPLAALGLDSQAEYKVHDLVTGSHYTWRGERNYVRLDPATQVAHVLAFGA